MINFCTLKLVSHTFDRVNKVDLLAPLRALTAGAGGLLLLGALRIERKAPGFVRLLASISVHADIDIDLDMNMDMERSVVAVEGIFTPSKTQYACFIESGALHSASGITIGGHCGAYFIIAGLSYVCCRECLATSTNFWGLTKKDGLAVLLKPIGSSNQKSQCMCK